MSASVNYPIVHIGLGKTGTTSLRQSVYPHISKLRPKVVYNDTWCMQELRKKLGLMTSEEEKIFHDYVQLNNNFISYETLVDWNPRNWQRAADRNLRLFGFGATILITVRETEDYLRSVYQQMVHVGNILRAEDFFINSAEYDRISPYLDPKILSRFDVDSFDLEYLYKIYEDRFHRVLIAPLSTLKELNFLKLLFYFDDGEIGILKSKLYQGKIYNRAYSSKAMSLTLKREQLLNSIGIFRGISNSFILQKLCNIFINKATSPKYYNLTISEKILQLPVRAIRRFHLFFKWRNFIQNNFDRIVPYQKFRLSKDVYRNEELAERNDNFINKFRMIAFKE